MFKFFYEIVRKDLIDFCGSDINKEFTFIFDINGDDGKVSFKKYENGLYTSNSIVEIRTKHPLILQKVILGKKGWGLWVKEWSLGISEGSFSMREILEEFTNRNIEIPDSFYNEFKNKIVKLLKEKLNVVR